MKTTRTNFLILCILFFTNNLFAQPGFLDPTFGNGGVVIEQRLGGTEGLSILPDGKILVAGDGENFYLDRFNPDGSNDAGFGVDGRVNISLDNKESSCSAMAIQPDGKIVLVGYIVPNAAYTDIAILRCKPDGSLDSSFGINGLASFDFNHYDYAYDVVIQPDGKIVVIGNFTKNLDDNFDSYILRLNTDGSIDENFGTEGINKIHYPLSTINVAVTIQPDGKLLMGGTYNKYGGKPDYIVERFNTDGSIDNSFGVNGTANFKFGEGQAAGWASELFDMQIQTDGKIICAGKSGLELSSMSLCRFNSNGNIDATFGENGGAIIDYNNFWSKIYSIFIQQDNKILATGVSISNPGPLLLLRLNEDGSLDPDFADNGIQATYFNETSAGKKVLLLPDSKILVAGDKGGAQIILARYNGDNVLAANFKEVKATQTNDAITITWQTLNESGTKSFTVERSSNANDYAGINTVPAKGVASSYSYTDKNPLSGTSYYRIRENAANGANTFSPVVKVVFNDNGIISLYPNPAKNTVTVKGLNKNTTAAIRITDMNGREISKQNFTQSNTATLNIRALAQGSYFVLVEENGKITKLRMIKE